MPSGAGRGGSPWRVAWAGEVHERRRRPGAGSGRAAAATSPRSGGALRTRRHRPTPRSAAAFLPSSRGVGHATVRYRYIQSARARDRALRPASPTGGGPRHASPIARRAGSRARRWAGIVPATSASTPDPTTPATTIPSGSPIATPGEALPLEVAVHRDADQAGEAVAERGPDRAARRPRAAPPRGGTRGARRGRARRSPSAHRSRAGAHVRPRASRWRSRVPRSSTRSTRSRSARSRRPCCSDGPTR